MAGAGGTIHFECIIALPKNIRILAAAIQCLVKLGKDVSLEANRLSRTLTLRCVNESKTSFVSFEFHGDFFEMFQVPQGESCTIQFPLKSCLPVFRSLKTMDKLSISVTTMDRIKHYIAFQAICLNDIIKTHHFYFEDAEALDPQFDRDDTKHRIRTRPKLLQEALARFVSAEEVLVTATSGVELTIASVHQDKAKATKKLKTSMTIPKTDFEEFLISEPKTQLMFTFREIRALLSFCTSPGVDIQDVLLLFNDPGEPCMFTTASHADDIVLATGLDATGTDEHPQLEMGRGRNFSFTLVLSTIEDDEGVAPDPTNAHYSGTQE